jgi:uncharacterized protein
MKLFVFPLPNMVLQPFTFKPLYIFEPRYLKMIKDSIESETPIGLASIISECNSKITLKNNKEITFVKKVCGFGFPHIVQQREDGSLIVLIDCIGKVALEKIVDDSRPYAVCEGRIIDELDSVTMKNQVLLDSLKNILVNWINKNSLDKIQKDQFINNLSSASQIIGSYSDFLIKEPEYQQAVLEINDINEKIRFIGLLNLSSNCYDEK